MRMMKYVKCVRRKHDFNHVLKIFTSSCKNGKINSPNFIKPLFDLETQITWVGEWWVLSGPSLIFLLGFYSHAAIIIVHSIIFSFNADELLDRVIITPFLI